MRANKEFWKQFNDEKISKYYKMPRTARDVAYTVGLIMFILGIGTGVGFWYLDVELENSLKEIDLINEAEYKAMIINYADCHTMKLILSNEPLDHTFRERLSSVWLVNCVKE
jgi:hypothetical protein